YDEEKRPQQFVQYDEDRAAVYEEIFQYSGEEDPFSSTLRYNDAQFTRTISCAENTIVETNEQGAYTNIYYYPKPGQEERTVFFRRDSVKKVTITTFTKNVKADEYGNTIELNRTDERGVNTRVVHRHFVYDTSEMLESRSIEAVIDQYVEAFRSGDFSTVLEDGYLFRNEALILNAPFAGKIFFPGQQWVSLTDEVEARAKATEMLRGIRTRRPLDWSKVRLEKIMDKEVREGTNGVGEGLYFGKCKVRMTDGQSGFTTYLQFIRVNDKWYIYQEK
ncbi:MAG: hypothetical protein AAGH79_11190, partial [Bacteroidota bacterium]